jgi:hypothetical protein
VQLLGLNEGSEVVDPSAVQVARKVALHNFIGEFKEYLDNLRRKGEVFF